MRSKKNSWVVRVIWVIPEGGARNHDCVYMLLEQLRYAGLIRVHGDSEFVTIAGKRYVKDIFDILPPHGVDSQAWAQMNADRMRSFALNAVAAPEWRDS